MAHVIGGSVPAADVLSAASRLSAVPFWRRRALGIERLTREHRLPPELAARLEALWELADRWYPDERPAVSSPRDVILLLDDMRRERRERLMVILLDARHRPLGLETVAIGGLNISRLAARDVFAPALRADAAAIVVAHNHPSGDATPSRSDRVVTAALRRAAELLGIAMIDHVILGRRDHHSFRESEGWDEAGRAA